MERILKYKLFFASCVIILAVGLMIGGIWVPPLLPIGGALLAGIFGGSIGFRQFMSFKNSSNLNPQLPDVPSENPSLEVIPPTRPNSPAAHHDENSCIHDSHNNQTNMFFIYGNRKPSNRGDDINMIEASRLDLTLV